MLYISDIKFGLLVGLCWAYLTTREMNIEIFDLGMCDRQWEGNVELYYMLGDGRTVFKSMYAGPATGLYYSIIAAWSRASSAWKQISQYVNKIISKFPNMEIGFHISCHKPKLFEVDYQHYGESLQSVIH